MKRIVRSWQISSLLVVLMTIFWAVLRPNEYEALLAETGYNLISVLTGVVFTAYILNLIPDFISTLQTRYFVGLITKTRSAIMMALLVFADVLVTISIFVGFFSLVIVFVGTTHGVMKDLTDIWEIFGFESTYSALTWLYMTGPTLTVSELGNPPIGIFFYSTFFATLWFVGFVGVVLGLKAVGVVTNRLVSRDFYNAFSEALSSPLKVVGHVLAMVLSVLSGIMILTNLS